MENEQSDAVATVEAVLEATALAVAGAAGMEAATLIGAGLAIRQALTWKRWRAELVSRVEQTGRRFNTESPADVAFVAKLTRAAMETPSEAKIVLLANAAVRSGTGKGLEPDFVQEHFTSLIVRFSADHVHVLHVLANRTRYCLPELGRLSVEDIVEALTHSADDDDDLRLTIGAIMLDLVAADLVHGGETRGLVPTPEPVEGLLTIEDEKMHTAKPAGVRFLRYVADHPIARDDSA